MTEHAVITIRGASEHLAAELGRLGVAAAPAGIDWCRCELREEQAQAIITSSQLATRVLRLVGVAGSEEALEALAKTVQPTGSFCVRANGEERQEREERLGAIIKTTSGAPVNLTKPDTAVYCHETDGALLLGIDLAGDLTKRHYKIITGSHSLSGPFAAAALYASGWQPDEDLLVWPCGTGELAIEAALLATGKSPRAYELRMLDSHEPTCRVMCSDQKQSLVRTAEKNAAVAGVAKAITFGRHDLDWLDIKHDEHAVRRLIGLLPNLALYPKLAPELVYQLDYILAPAGTASFLCVNDASVTALDAAASAYERTHTHLWLGKHPYTLITLVRKTQKA